MYGYQYDDLNRLLKGNYRKLGYSVTGNYDETLSYDKHGNIQTLQRNGFADADFGTSVEIDNLVYAYDGNQLLAVQDMSNSLNGFRDNVNNGNPDYGYDAYGNMLFDSNKGINNIFYNHLNLPVRIFFSNGNRIYFTYNAQGVKLKKEILENSGTTTITDYLDGFQYKNEALSFFPTAEGYVEFATPTKLFYVYNYTDHLGNVRMSYTDNGAAVPKILEESHYYPFGLKHENYASEKFNIVKEPNGNLYVIQPTERREWQYKYNGKEWQDELGLNFYDYGARNYDAAIGRWMNVDPLAEVSRRWNPYNYCYNNPVYFIDPDGMRAEASQTAPIYYDWEEGGWRTQDGDEVKAEDAIGAINGLAANVGAAAVDQSVGGISASLKKLTFDITPADFKNYFKVKMMQFDAFYNEKAPILRDHFEAGELVGGSMEIISLLAAPLTDGASLAFLPVGGAISTYGTYGNIAMDFYEEKEGSGFYRFFKWASSAGMAKAFEKIPFKKLYYLISGYVKVLETVVLPQIEESGKRFLIPPKLIKH